MFLYFINQTISYYVSWLVLITVFVYFHDSQPNGPLRDFFVFFRLLMSILRPSWCIFSGSFPTMLSWFEEPEDLFPNLRGIGLFPIKIKLDGSEFLHHLPPGASYHCPLVKVIWTILNFVTQFIPFPNSIDCLGCASVQDHSGQHKIQFLPGSQLLVPGL